MLKMIIGLAALFGTDQYIKKLIDQKFCTSEEKRNGDKKPLEKDVLNGKVKLRKLYNKGIAFSKLSNHPDAAKKISFAGVAIVLAYFIVLMFRKEQHGLRWAITFILSGSLSNLVDRIRKGYVIDYFSINTKRPGKSKLVFNLGDIFIFIGAIIIIFVTVFVSE